MARIAALSTVSILDTSWLLELYRVPGFFDASRTVHVHTTTAEIVAQGALFVTVPVLFEVASHITRVPDGRRRRVLAGRLRDDITRSVERDSPWTIISVGTDILLREADVVQLAERFLELVGPNYSFADISIVDLATELRRRGRTVRILAFDDQLESYSD